MNFQISTDLVVPIRLSHHFCMETPVAIWKDANESDLGFVRLRPINSLEMGVTGRGEAHFPFLHNIEIFVCLGVG